METPSIEDLANRYTDAMDRIWLLNTGHPVSLTDQEWLDVYNRNIKFLEDMLLETYWTDAQREPIILALNKFKVAQ